MVHSEDISKEMVNIYSKHPDLLVIDESTWPMVESILVESSREAYSKLTDDGAVHI